MRHWIYAAVAFAVLLVTLLLILVPVAGADIIEGDDTDDYLVGDEGYDQIRGRGGDDFISGRGSGDDLYGGFGADVVKGGGGDDFMAGGPGPDDMRAASDDSGGDFIDCGDGFDQVWLDPGDVSSPDCEDVNYVY
jgi:Ca2+-binding RTX toxin-like protein